MTTPFSPRAANEKVIDVKQTRGRRSTRTKTTTTTQRKHSLETAIGGWLSVLNFGFLFMPEPLSNDALDQAEIEALAKQINKVAQQNETVYKYLSYILAGGGGAFDLAITVGIIAGRRMARHGVIPAEYDASLGMMLTKLGATEEPMSVYDGSSENTSGNGISYPTPEVSS